MNTALATRKDERGISASWIWRMMLGVGLIGFSLWGIPFCQEIFPTFIGIGPNLSPTEMSFAKLAADVAWVLLFGPILAAGIAALWFALRKLGELDRLQVWREARVAQAFALQPSANLHGSSTFSTEEDFHDRLEALSAAEVAQLTERANRIAFLLGLAAGTFFVILGVFGLILVSSPSLRYSGTIRFAIASGISILAGLKVLQRTFCKEDTSWLLPLRVFTHLVLRRPSLFREGQKAGRSRDTS